MIAEGSERGATVLGVGEAVTVTVSERSEDVVVGYTDEGLEVLLPVSEDYVTAPVSVGDRVAAVVTDVEDGCFVVSRTARRLVRRAVETFVPEVAAGEVRVMGVVRIPGERCKISVASTVEGVNPLPVCVGKGGRRVKKIEDRVGDRVEMIAWDPDRVQRIIKALAPASVLAVRVNLEKGSADVICDQRNAPAAVGRGGSNIFLASRLVGLRLQVIAEG